MLLASPVFVFSFFIFSPAREAFFGPNFGSSDSDPSKPPLTSLTFRLSSLAMRCACERIMKSAKRITRSKTYAAEEQGEEESLQRLLGWCCWFLLLLLLWELQHSRVATGRWKLCKRKSKLFIWPRAIFRRSTEMDTELVQPFCGMDGISRRNIRVLVANLNDDFSAFRDLNLISRVF